MKYSKWKFSNAEKVLVYVRIKCPACNETFMTKAVLRKHLHKDHTISELDILLKKLK